MADNGSGARRPPPPPVHKPTGERRALMPPPPPGARRFTGAMPAATPPRPGSFSGPKPAPEPPSKKANALRENVGGAFYGKLASAIFRICDACGLDRAQFMSDGNSLIFRDTSTLRDVRIPVEFPEGKPEVRIHLDALGLGQAKDEACGKIIGEFGAGSIGEARIRMLASMRHVYVRVSEEGISLCGSGKPDGPPFVYLFLELPHPP